MPKQNVAHVVLVINASMSFLTCVDHNSALLVGSRQSLFLIYANSLGLFVMVAIVFASSALESWPASLTLQRLLESHGVELWEWVAAVRETRILVLECRLAPAMQVPIHVVEERLSILRDCWVQAKTRDSLFEGILNECLQELAELHETLAGGSMYSPPDAERLRIMQEVRCSVRSRRGVIGVGLGIVYTYTFVSTPPPTHTHAHTHTHTGCRSLAWLV